MNRIEALMYYLMDEFNKMKRPASKYELDAILRRWAEETGYRLDPEIYYYEVLDIGGAIRIKVIVYNKALDEFLLIRVAEVGNKKYDVGITVYAKKLHVGFW